MTARPTLALLLAVAASLAGCDPGPSERQGAVLVLLDTLRADRVGAYDYERDTTPAIDRLAAEGALFEQVVTNASWTLPAVAGLLSGRTLTAKVFDRTLGTSLVEVLADAGVRTAAFTEGGYVSAVFDMDRGFQDYRETEGPVRLRIRGQPVSLPSDGGIERTFAEAIDWLDGVDDERFFLLVHTYEPHTPYRRRQWAEGIDPGRLGETFEILDTRRVLGLQPPLTPEELEYVSGLYDGGVEQADRHVGLLVDALERRGLLERTLLVVTSDHGESLGFRSEHIVGDHGHAVYDELVRVPLVLRDPYARRPAQRVSTQVRTLDVMPTVLDWLGEAVPPGLQGRSLLPLLRGEAGEHRVALTRTLPVGRKGARASLRDGHHKLIVNDPLTAPEGRAIEVYDLHADPGEQQNLADAELRDRLQARLERALEPVRRAGAPDLRPPDVLPDDLRERLESLGYVQD